MTAKAILDTDILSEYFKGHNATVVKRATADYAVGSRRFHAD